VLSPLTLRSRLLSLCAIAGLTWFIGAAGTPSAHAARLSEASAPQALTASIVVNTTDQEVNNDGDCSLQEAIWAANFDANLAIDPNSLNGPKISCWPPMLCTKPTGRLLPVPKTAWCRTSSTRPG
jgi:CSLREA domain-containing protein